MSRSCEERTIRAMITIYCRGQHRGRGELCADCAALLDYARLRLGKYLFGEDKPVCAECPVHCYRPAMREQVRTVMRYAGPRMILRHPLLALSHALHKRRSLLKETHGAAQQRAKSRPATGLAANRRSAKQACECCVPPSEGSACEVPRS